MLNSARPRQQAGLALVEALVAMLVLSVGVGALAWTQARQLAEGRNTVARATAMLLAQDLGNRMLFNRDAAAHGHYRLNWGERPAATACPDACSGAMLAQADLSAWREALAQSLPAGDAHVFSAGAATRRIGVAISWNLGNATDPTWQTPWPVDAAGHGVDCPAHRNCHVAYLPI